MQNPFDPTKDKEKFEFFDQMTNAINAFLLNKFPQFDEDLIQRIEQLKIAHREANDEYKRFKLDMQRERENFLKHAKEKINNFLSDKYPGLAQESSIVLTDMKTALKQVLSTDKRVQERLKKVINNESIYEDFYKIRDDFGRIKKQFDKMTSTMKKLFE